MSLEINAPRRMSIPSAWELLWTSCRSTVVLILPRLSQSDAIAAHDEAIRILASSTSDLDHREWAERHLCGMADADKSAFMRDWKRQS